MPEWLGIVLMVHGFGTVLILLFAGLDLAASSPRQAYREDRKRDARIMLASPLWLPIALTYGIYRLIQIARTGE